MPVFPPDVTFSERDYVAPTFYKKAGLGITGGWNYYGTLQEAQAKFLYLNRKGGYNAQPAGYLTFAGTAAETGGINADFYLYIYASNSFSLISYKELKGMSLTGRGIVARFYKTDGSGPYYTIVDPNVFSLSATSIQSVGADKLAALDSYYREVNLLKYRYNNLVGFLNSLAQRQLNAKEQQIFNEGILRLQNMQQEISTLRGIEITYTSEGAVIGFIPILIIAIVAILAAVTGWTIYEIASMKEKTKQINDAYNLSMWVASKKQELAQQVQAGLITQAQADDINGTLDDAAKVANKVADNASKKDAGIFDGITNVIKWGIVGYLVFTFAKPRQAKQAN